MVVLDTAKQTVEDFVDGYNFILVFVESCIDITVSDLVLLLPKRNDLPLLRFNVLAVVLRKMDVLSLVDVR